MSFSDAWKNKEGVKIWDMKKNPDKSPKETGKFENMTDEQLTKYAEQKGIDISRFSSRVSIITKLENEEKKKGGNV